MVQRHGKDTTLKSGLSPRKRLIATRFARAQHYDKHAAIQKEICQRLTALIMTPKQQSVLEIGAGSGQLTRMLAQSIQSECWIINELCQVHSDTLQQIIPAATVYIGDGEVTDYESSALGRGHSLIVSANAIQWFDQPLDFITQAAHQLRRGGQLLFSTFTPQHFHEVKSLTGQGLDYPCAEQRQAALHQAGFQVLHCLPHKRTLSFTAPYEVLRHLKNTGVTASAVSPTSQQRDKNFWNKSRLARFDQQYRQRFSYPNNDKADNVDNIKDGNADSVSLTYEALIISAIKP